MEEAVFIAQTDLQFTIISLRLVDVQNKIWKIIFGALTAISCPLKALDMFT